MFKPLLAQFVRWLTRPRMLHGFRGHDGAWLAHTRVSTATDIEARDKLRIEDHVFIGHFNFIDASGGLFIGEGTQITNHVSLRHGSPFTRWGALLGR
jgi:hypothetical protein